MFLTNVLFDAVHGEEATDGRTAIPSQESFVLSNNLDTSPERACDLYSAVPRPDHCKPPRPTKADTQNAHPLPRQPPFDRRHPTSQPRTDNPPFPSLFPSRPLLHVLPRGTPRLDLAAQIAHGQVEREVHRAQQLREQQVPAEDAEDEDEGPGRLGGTARQPDIRRGRGEKGQQGKRTISSVSKAAVSPSAPFQ